MDLRSFSRPVARFVTGQPKLRKKGEAVKYILITRDTPHSPWHRYGKPFDDPEEALSCAKVYQFSEAPGSLAEWGVGKLHGRRLELWRTSLKEESNG